MSSEAVIRVIPDIIKKMIYIRFCIKIHKRKGSGLGGERKYDSY